VATQEQRKAETRRLLLDAAAELFAERGIEAVSIDTVAEAADRTSGAVYAHFGNKEGLLNALLESLVNETASVMEAELSVGGDRDEQLTALWRTFADPPPGPGQGWMLLEHELWLYASRHEPARAHLAARFDEARRMVADSMRTFEAEGHADLPGTPEEVAPLVLAMLVGLEMQHRIDPDAVPYDAAVIGLRAVTGLGQPSDATVSTRPTSTPSTSTP
jgi:AcrR family transcriptional regulator